MILLASGNTLAKRHGHEPWLSQLLCPRSRNRVTTPRYGVDNSAFSGRVGPFPGDRPYRYYFEAQPYWDMCFRLQRPVAKEFGITRAELTRAIQGAAPDEGEL